MAKQKVLENLNNTYCRLKRSKLEGIGVFAIRDIPENTDPFLGVKKQKWQKVNAEKIKPLDKNIQKMVSDFFGLNDKNEFLIPECGLNCIDISFFMNTSKKPNIKTIDYGTNFITTKAIKKSTELTVSYETYDIRYKKHGK